MTVKKHTQGEWRATFRGVDQGQNWASRIPYAIERAVGGAVLPIADICDQPEAEANARLIASAPELLAALVALTTNPHGDLGDMIYHVKERENAGWGGPAVTAWGNAITLARQAVAKATGNN